MARYHANTELVRDVAALDRRSKTWFVLRCIEYLPESAPCRAEVMAALRDFASGEGRLNKSEVDGILYRLADDHTSLGVRGSIDIDEHNALCALDDAMLCAYGLDNSLDRNPLTYALSCHDYVVAILNKNNGKQFKAEMKLYLKELKQVDQILEKLISGG